MDFTALLHTALTAFFTTAAPIIVVFSVKAFQAIARKFHIEANQTELAMVQSVAQDAIAYAEQMAKVQIAKSSDGSAPMSSADKKKAAIDFANQVAKAHGMSDFAIEMLDGAIEAALGQFIK